jgi:hypothetical protein
LCSFLLLIHAADDLASFLMYPLGQLVTRGGKRCGVLG